MIIRELAEPDFVLCSKCQRSVERKDINGGVCDRCSRKWYGERTTPKEVENRDYLTPDKRQSMEICVQAVCAGIEYQILKQRHPTPELNNPCVFGARLAKVFGFHLDFAIDSRGTVMRQDGYALIVPHLTDLFGSHESLTEGQLNSVQAIWSGIRYALYERYETKEMNDNYKVGFGVMLAKAYEYDLNDLGQVVTRTSGRSVLGKHEVEVLMREFKYGNSDDSV